ncbi:transporter family protein [Roseovarius salinarum]|uniref:alpha-amylase n=1 Tax=Roseovarius salinarum TaxID=1981892 RepID=UPI000C34233D|nr:alpha-amylase [Roseovarius salinarum]
MKLQLIPALVLGAGLAAGAAAAQDTAMAKPAGGKMAHGHMHGPIGVTGRHTPPQGKLMLSYRYGGMSMSGSRMGTTDVSPDYIVTALPNRFFGRPGQPPTLRVAPREMTKDMHMLGAMYGVADRLTLMAMLPYVEKSMTMRSYAGPVGTTVLGDFTTHSRGLGDIKLGALFGLAGKGRNASVARLGLSLPTGSITETDRVLSPMGTRPVKRLGYGMQLGSGTVDLRPAITLQRGRGAWNWGAQLGGVVRLGTNDEGYALGDGATAVAWASWRAAPWISLSGGVEARTMGAIDGIDPNIVGAATGADPRNSGGDKVIVFAGADLTARRGALKGHKLGLELGVPVYQDLNGVQSKGDWRLRLAWRRAF